MKIIEAFSRIWPVDLLETEYREVTNALTAIFSWRVAVIGSNLDALQPWTVRKKVLGRYSLVLGQCLYNVLRFFAGRAETPRYLCRIDEYKRGVRVFLKESEHRNLQMSRASTKDSRVCPPDKLRSSRRPWVWTL